MNPVEKMILVMMTRDMRKLFGMENSLTRIPQAIQAIDEPPERKWPNLDTFSEGTQLPYKFSTQRMIMKNMFAAGADARVALNSIEENPAEARDTIEPQELEELEEVIKGVGVGAYGFTKLPQDLIFKDRAVLFDSTIVLAFELDKDEVASAPSKENYLNSIQSYDSLGGAANQVAAKLREMGFAAQVSHPLGGLVLYPPLAAKAGMGLLGRHGLVITPEFGPRQRLCAVFTNISNLPFADEGFAENPGCETCGKCKAACPGKAFYDEPICHPTGRKELIDMDKCSVQFAIQNCCSICMRECAAINPGKGSN